MSKPLWMLVREAFERKNYFSPPTELRDELVGIATDYAQQQTAAARAEIERLTKAHDTVCGALAEAIKRAEKAEAALEAYGREKVREGMRMAAKIADQDSSAYHIRSEIRAAMETLK